MGRDGGRDGKAGGLRADLQQFACFCASPQLTCVLTKFIANGLFTKWSQQVDLRTRSEVSANLRRLPAALPLLFLISMPEEWLLIVSFFLERV